MEVSMDKQIGLLSMFDENDTTLSNTGEIKIMNLELLNSEFTTWEDLFTGYDKLYAVTYSSSIDFITKLLPKFEKVEIIFGFEKILNGLDDIMAYQQATLEELKHVFNKSEKKLLDKIDDESLKLYVMRNKVSHKKVYLLEGKNKTPRVITGSANLSNSAFSGKQLENIYVLNGDKAFQEFFTEYNEMKVDSVDSISKKAIILADEEDIENIPIISTVKLKKLVIIETETNNNPPDTILIRHEHIKNKYKDIVPKPDKMGKVFLDIDKINKITKKASDIKIQKQFIERKTPKLMVDINNYQVILEGKPLDLEPNTEDIENDVNLFIKYMDGFRTFLGDTEDAIKKYYAFANWFFASPFMSVMRSQASIHNKPITPYPIFGLIYGKSNAGKSKFLETLMIMMSRQKILLPAKEFTKSVILNLRQEMLGFPIAIDDLNNRRFRDHAIELIKDDSYISDNFSAIAISANEDVKAVENELSKRMIVCHVNASLPKMAAMKGSLVRRTQKNIGTAFYREYLGRMMKNIPSLVGELFDEQKEAPDIFALSSRTIKDILSQYYDGDVPDWAVEIKLDYYFETLAEQNIKNKIINMWNSNSKMFRIDKKTNLLYIDTGDYHEANRIVGELPSYIQKGTANGVIILDLNYAKQYFEQDFSISIFERFKR